MPPRGPSRKVSILLLGYVSGENNLLRDALGVSGEAESLDRNGTERVRNPIMTYWIGLEWINLGSSERLMSRR
jgi:hypothetical protein